MRRVSDRGKKEKDCERDRKATTHEVGGRLEENENMQVSMKVVNSENTPYKQTF